MKEKNGIEKLQKAEERKILTGRDFIKREEEESEVVKVERDADKESIMKLCSAGSVKGSNLLIKDRD